jgi:ubiquinone/menaquinone biosynthesis C-methylase UbiE
MPAGDGPPRYDESAAAIYGEDYAAQYSAFYIAQWPRKHALNVANLTRTLDALPMADPLWLDLACGQAWHFSRFIGRARMVGLDLSEAQLQRARLGSPAAAFVRADMSRAPFAPASIDLVTNFWAGYCYLASRERIGSMLRDAVSWIRPGGALYIEVLLARDLESFNRSHFSDATAFVVVPRSADYTEWRYDDVGGQHIMTSPPLELFVDILAAEFEQIEARHDRAFMVHLIATGRKG